MGVMAALGHECGHSVSVFYLYSIYIFQATQQSAIFSYCLTINMF